MFNTNWVRYSASAVVPSKAGNEVFAEPTTVVTTLSTPDAIQPDYLLVDPSSVTVTMGEVSFPVGIPLEPMAVNTTMGEVFVAVMEIITEDLTIQQLEDNSVQGSSAAAVQQVLPFTVGMAQQSEVFIGDIGTTFTINIKNAGAPVNISKATTIEYIFKKPRGQVSIKTPSFVTDGTDGQLSYKTVTGDIDQIGTWRLIARMSWADGTFHTQTSQFLVKASII